MNREEQARLWRQKIRGWEMAAERDRLRPPSSDVLQEIGDLFLLARDIPKQPFEDAEVEVVRQRWIRIKRGRKTG